MANIQAQNGIVHIIQEILSPPSLTKAEIFELEKFNMQIVPNPISNTFRITGGQEIEDGRFDIELYNSIGQIIERWSDKRINQPIELIQRHIGNYYILLKNNNKTLFKN